jgi:ribosomal-protein-alanine N-acetyltransferase
MAAHIEAVGSEAAALLAEIHAEAFPANQAWGAAAFTSMLALPGHFGLIAISQDQPLGFALARAQGPEAEIVTIAVRPGAHGQGFGRLLLTSVMAEAARRGAVEIFLEVAEPNAAARALYAAAGAREVGRRPRYYADAADAFVLRIDLAGTTNI